MKAYVTDTHPLVWYALNTRKLSHKVEKIFSQCEAGKTLVYIPKHVIQEISLLLRIGRFKFKVPVREWYKQLTKIPTIMIMSLEPETIFTAQEINLPQNADPFDRMIVASALELGLPLITVDEQIEKSGLVETIW